MESVVSSTKRDVFSRLLRDAELRQQRQEPTSEAKNKDNGPRHKIENDLLNRGKLSKARISSKKAQILALERRELTWTPQLTNTTRLLVDSKVNDEEEVEKKPVFNVACTLRNMDNCSIEDLSVKVNLAQSLGNPIQAPTSFDFMDGIPNEDNVADEVSEKDVVKRTLLWQKRKQKKIQKKISEKASLELDGCTFKPKLTPFKSRKEFSMSTLTFMEQYRNLSPSKTRVAYANGFDVGTFMAKAQPMIGHLNLF